MAPKLHLVRTPAPTPQGAPPGDLEAAPTTTETTEKAAAAPTQALTLKQGALVRSGMPMMYRIVADAVQCAADPRVTEPELLGIAAVALHEAALHFRPGESANFLYYARIRVRGEVREAIAVLTHRVRLRPTIEDRMERASDDFSSTQILPVKMLTDSPEVLAEAMRQGAADALAVGYVASLHEGQHASPEEELIELEGKRATTAALAKAIATLYPHEREILQVIYVQEMTQQDAAATLGIHRNTVKNRLTTAIRKLREQMIGPGS